MALSYPFLVYFSPFIIKTEKYKLKKHKCCSWGSNRNGHKMVSTNGTTELYGGFCIQYCHTYNVNEFLAAKTWEERWKEWKERNYFGCGENVKGWTLLDVATVVKWSVRLSSGNTNFGLRRSPFRQSAHPANAGRHQHEWPGSLSWKSMFNVVLS